MTKKNLYHFMLKKEELKLKNIKNFVLLLMVGLVVFSACNVSATDEKMAYFNEFEKDSFVVRDRYDGQKEDRFSVNDIKTLTENEKFINSYLNNEFDIEVVYGGEQNKNVINELIKHKLSFTVYSLEDIN